MRRLWLAFLLGSVVMVLSGCGDPPSKPEEVVKDAAYYKERFRQATTIKSLNTETKVLFTMKSLRDNFIKQFDVNGTNEGINRDIIDQFQRQLEKQVENDDAFVITDKTPIILAGKKDDSNTTPRLDTQLKRAIGEICGVDCKRQDVDRWFEQHQDALEKNAEDNSGVDQTDDLQKFLANPPPDPMAVLFASPPPPPPPIYRGGHFVEVQALRAGLNQWADQNIMP